MISGITRQFTRSRHDHISCFPGALQQSGHWPICSIARKMQQFYFNHLINLLAIFMPGITQWWLFQTVHDAKTSFHLIQPQDDDRYYTIKQNIVGDPSIIFASDAEVGCIFTQDDFNLPCANIIVYNTNTLFLDCIDKIMPCGGCMHSAALKFKQDSMLFCEDMFHWMEAEDIHTLHVCNHISKIYARAYLVDGHVQWVLLSYMF